MPSDPPDWFHEIDHTGDVGIHVTAPTLPTLFERAAHGMFRVLSNPETVHSSDVTRIAVHGRDREALMVEWLSELNYRHTVDHMLYRTFDVHSLDRSNDEFQLSAEIRGESIDPERHTVFTEIKAVTFHGMEILETNGHWSVQVIFDM